MPPVPTVRKSKHWRMHSRKDFLNRPHHHSDASLWSQVTVNQSSEGVDCYVGFKIRDCDRTVNLSFSANNDTDFANSLHKVNKMLTHLTAFRKSMQKAWVKTKELKKKK